MQNEICGVSAFYKEYCDELVNHYKAISNLQFSVVSYSNRLGMTRHALYKKTDTGTMIFEPHITYLLLKKGRRGIVGALSVILRSIIIIVKLYIKNEGPTFKSKIGTSFDTS